MTDEQLTEDASVALIRALIENLEDAADDWESFSLVLGLNEGRFFQAYGYAYSPDGTISAVTVSPRAVRPEVERYLAGYFGPDDALPIKLLVQFDSTTGRYGVTFEDTDAERWKVSPANIDAIREELRPAFD